DAAEDVDAFNLLLRRHRKLRRRKVMTFEAKRPEPRRLGAAGQLEMVLDAGIEVGALMHMDIDGAMQQLEIRAFHRGRLRPRRIFLVHCLLHQPAYSAGTFSRYRVE